MRLIRASGGGLSGKGCVGHNSSPGVSLFGTGRSSTPKMGWPVSRLRINSKPIFVICASAGIVLPSCFTSINAGGALRRAQIVVPDVVMNHLVIPAQLTGAASSASTQFA